MPDDNERLIILVEAKIAELEKQMAKASGVTGKAYREMSLGSKRATTQMENDAIRAGLRINQALASTSAKVGAFGRSFAGGFVGPVASLLTLTAAVNGTKAALDKFGKVADQSAAAGIDPEFFQGLAYQANLAGIETDELARAMETFAKNSGLAAENKGRMVTTLEALNPKLLESIKHAASQEDRFKLVADAIKDAKNQAEAAAIASAAFGEQGVKIAAAFKDGSAAIDETMAKARELGIIVDHDVIAKADEYGDKWDTAATIIDTKVKIALTNLAPGMVWLVDRVADLAREAENFAEALASPQDFLAWLGGGSGAESRMNQALDALRTETISQRFGVTTGGIGAGPNARDLENLFGIRLKSPPPPMPTGGGDAGTGEAFDFRAFLDGQYKQSLEGYPDIFNRTTEAAGKTASAVIDNADAVTELAQRWEAAEDLAQNFASTFISGMRSGRTAIESAIDAVGNLGDQLLQMAANQAIRSLFSALTGGLGMPSIAGGAAIPMGGFIPSLTGPRLFAEGTANTGGRRGEPMGIVHGQEAVIPLPNGGKVPVQMQGGGDTGVHVTVGLSVDSELVIRPYVEKITERRIREFDRTIPSKVRQGIIQYQKSPDR